MRGARCGRKRRRILLKVAAPEETYNPCRPLSEAKEAGRDVVRAYLYTLYYLISFGVLRGTPQFGIYCYYEGEGSLLNLGISGSNVTRGDPRGSEKFELSVRQLSRGQSNDHRDT